MREKLDKHYLLITEGDFGEDRIVYGGEGRMHEWKKRLGKEPDAKRYGLQEFVLGETPKGFPFLHVSREIANENENYNLPTGHSTHWMDFRADKGLVELLVKVVEDIKDNLRGRNE